VTFVPRPQGVEIVHPDESTTFCELAYGGTDGRGFHVWAVVTPLGPGDMVVVAVMPPRTSVTFPGDRT
jgi:hypothetical protein